LEIPFQKKIRNESQTLEIAEQLAEFIMPGNVVVLDGNLGAGKTFLIKAICSFWGIEDASSPTFAIIQEYVGKRKVFHLDFYRIKKVEELYDLGIEDYFNDSSAVIFIEWGELFPDVLPHNRINIKIVNDDNGEREIKVLKNE
jgi:tRNA threonylcarbamoyladenosine biosynthesis protein TsaE